MAFAQSMEGTVRAMKNSVISLRAVDLYFQKKRIFEKLCLSLSSGGISFLVGENGAGKSQLLRMINGIIVPDSGEISRPNTVEQAYLNQQPILLNRSVYSNLYFIGRGSVSSRRYVERKIQAIIELFQLQHYLQQPVVTLSGGQQKRVAIARLFLQKAQYYLLDEPSANIDHSSNLLIENSIGELLSNGKKVIISSHDFFQIERLFKKGQDEIHLIGQGRCLHSMNTLDLDYLSEYL